MSEHMPGDVYDFAASILASAVNNRRKEHPDTRLVEASAQEAYELLAELDRQIDGSGQWYHLKCNGPIHARIQAYLAKVRGE